MTPLKRRREKDDHAPYRSAMPDRAVLVYANKVRALFPGVPVVLGGIEASLRRFAHYDYWENRVRRSLLLDSRADILVYGPGESRPSKSPGGWPKAETFRGSPGPVSSEKTVRESFIEVPLGRGRRGFAPRPLPRPRRRCPSGRPWPRRMTRDSSSNIRPRAYTPDDLDRIYGLPFSRKIPESFPEFRMAQFSVVTHRGCFGHCSFCALALHQGETIVSRSEESILEEIRRLVRHPDFKGYIDDFGGPTANMYGMDCDTVCGKPCLDCSKPAAHDRLIALLRKARAIPGVKKIFVRSGVRYDLALESGEYIRELVGHHVSGLLKIAPEHVSKKVLRLMNKDRGRSLRAVPAGFP